MEITFDESINAKRAYREIRILSHLQHPCIVQLLDIVSPAVQEYANKSHDGVFVPIPRALGHIYLVFEHIDTDLSKIFRSNQHLHEEHIQYILYQLLDGIRYLHSANVIHRDLKPANILVSCANCSIKIADFGLARVVGEDLLPHHNTEHDGVSGDGRIRLRALSSDSLEHHHHDHDPAVHPDHLEAPSPRLPAPPSLHRALTKHVITRWYRAPEVILCAPYSAAVDLWSIGCIFGELLNMLKTNQPDYHKRRPLFPGDSCGDLSNDEDVGDVEGVVQQWEEAMDSLAIDKDCKASAKGSSKSAKGVKAELTVTNPSAFPSANPSTCTSAEGKDDMTTSCVLYSSLYGANWDANASAQAEVDLHRYQPKSQLSLILDLIGTPCPDDLTHLDKRSFAMLSTARKRTPKDLKELYPACNKEDLDMLSAFLQFNPSKRMDTELALGSKYFDRLRVLGYVSTSPGGPVDVCKTPLSVDKEKVRESQLNLKHNVSPLTAALHLLYADSTCSSCRRS